MRFILGPLIIAAGIAMMKYSFWITEQTGKIDFAEKYLQPPLAGTYTWWKIVAFIIICGALAWMGGFLDFGAVGNPPGL